MTNLLEQINSPKDLKKLTLEEKETLSQEIRDLIIDVTSKNGGHVASNLGVVELTIALHSIFDTPKDKIVWDVGHQCYVHKILTGRREEFQNIRKLGGISGFPKICDSEYDNFNTGHSSTSISIATGMARAGLKPVLPIYSSFLQRGYDQTIHDIALSRIPVTVCIDRAGIVGNDGETHQGIFDLSFLSSIPNIVIMAPKNFEELDKMLEFGVNLDKPVFIRYPRGGENFSFESTEDIELGKAEIVQEGTDLSIIAIGNMVGRAEEVASLLPEKSVEIINARFLKPLDEETILNSIRKTGHCITMEDNLLKGGLGSAVVEAVNKSDIQDVKIKNFGYDDTFVEHGTVKELEDKYGLSAEKISGKLFTFTEM